MGKFTEHTGKNTTSLNPPPELGVDYVSLASEGTLVTWEVESRASELGPEMQLAISMYSSTVHIHMDRARNFTEALSSFVSMVHPLVFQFCPVSDMC